MSKLPFHNADQPKLGVNQEDFTNRGKVFVQWLLSEDSFHKIGGSSMWLLYALQEIATSLKGIEDELHNINAKMME